jgi:hypothetical protein
MVEQSTTRDRFDVPPDRNGGTAPSHRAPTRHRSRHRARQRPAETLGRPESHREPPMASRRPSHCDWPPTFQLVSSGLTTGLARTAAPNAAFVGAAWRAVRCSAWVTALERTVRPNQSCNSVAILACERPRYLFRITMNATACGPRCVLAAPSASELCRGCRPCTARFHVSAARGCAQTPRAPVAGDRFLDRGPSVTEGSEASANRRRGRPRACYARIGAPVQEGPANQLPGLLFEM